MRRADSPDRFQTIRNESLIGSLMLCMPGTLFPASALVLAGVFDESLSGVIIVVTLIDPLSAHVLPKG